MFSLFQSVVSWRFTEFCGFEAVNSVKRNSFLKFWRGCFLQFVFKTVNEVFLRSKQVINVLNSKRIQLHRLRKKPLFFSLGFLWSAIPNSINNIEKLLKKLLNWAQLTVVEFYLRVNCRIFTKLVQMFDCGK